MIANPNPRIVHVTECLASGTLGFLAQATRELAGAGVRQVLLFSRRPDTPADVEAMFDPRVELIELPALNSQIWRYVRALRTALLAQLQEPEDTFVHLHSSKAGFLGRIALMGLRKLPPVYYSPHGLAFLNRRFVVPSLLYTALEWFAARVVRSTPVGCSRGEAALLGKLSPRPARVLENAVDDAFFQIERREGEVPLVLSMGRICYQKAPERFAAMAVRFQIAEVPARFVWIGNGDPVSEARLRAAGVHVTGWLGRDEIRRLLGEASLYVQTSRWEGMPLSVLQALAAGVPCVVTDVVGNRDAVRQGISGFVAGDDDELLIGARRLLRDAGLRARFSEAARQDAVERFCNAAFRERLFRLYGVTPVAASAGTPVANLLRFARPMPPLPTTPPAAPGYRRRING